MQNRFENVIGQKTAVAYLQRTLEAGHIAQAYIFSGEKGSGKLDLALAFAAVLQCENKKMHSGNMEPCGECRSCRQIRAGTHPDVRIVTNESVGIETKTQIVGVNVARFIQSDTIIKPYTGPYKIYIIPNAQNMNQQAQNALLKTLEEPPAYALYLLLADNTASFLPTILSRCILLSFHPAGEEELLAALEKQGITGQKARIAAGLSHGNAGRCMELVNEEETERFRKDMTALLKKMPDVNAHEIMQYAEGVAPKKKDGGINRAGDFLDMGRSWFRDLLLAKGAPQTENLIFCDEAEYIKGAAKQLSYPALEEIQEAFDEAEKRRSANGNDAQILEVLLIRIRRAMRTIPGEGKR